MLLGWCLGAPTMLRAELLPPRMTPAGQLAVLRLRCCGTGRLHLHLPDRRGWAVRKRWLRPYGQTVELVVPPGTRAVVTLVGPLGDEHHYEIGDRPGQIELTLRQAAVPPLPTVAVPSVSVSLPLAPHAQAGGARGPTPCLPVAQPLLPRVHPAAVFAAPSLPRPVLDTAALRIALPAKLFDLTSCAARSLPVPAAPATQREGSLP
jgi:hypothetical protein